MNRRNLLKQLGLLGLTPSLSTLASPGHPTTGQTQPAGHTPANARKRTLRFAHLTDIHIQPELRAAEGLAACLHHLQGQSDAPSFILNSGDCVFDSLKQTKDRVNLQWDLWHDVFKKENSLPIEYCIGNHDCWGMGETTDPLYGKKFALEKMRLEHPYHSYDKGGWHFIMLDSVQPKSDGSWYTMKLDDEQFSWLQNDLASTPATTPIVVVSHVPILSAAVISMAQSKGEEGYIVSGGLMHTDSAKIVALLNQHKNVKLCLSGHIHLYEQIKYDGITFISNGAVSGNWWKGIHEQTGNGYAMINLYDDGSFENDYFLYGWNS